MQIDLAREEAELLSSILENDLSDLRMEIADTDSKDFRDHLREQEVFLKDMLQRLGRAEG